MNHDLVQIIINRLTNIHDKISIVTMNSSIFNNIKIVELNDTRIDETLLKAKNCYHDEYLWLGLISLRMLHIDFNLNFLADSLVKLALIPEGGEIDITHINELKLKYFHGVVRFSPENDRILDCFAGSLEYLSFNDQEWDTVYEKDEKILYALQKLRVLKIRGLENIKNVAFLSNLEELDISETLIDDQGIMGLKLKSLNISHNENTDLNTYTNPNLLVLKAKGTEITQLALERFPTLIKLILRNTANYKSNISNLSFLQKTLKVLKFNDANLIRDLSGLKLEQLAINFHNNTHKKLDKKDRVQGLEDSYATLQSLITNSLISENIIAKFENLTSLDITYHNAILKVTNKNLRSLKAAGIDTRDSDLSKYSCRLKSITQDVNKLKFLSVNHNDYFESECLEYCKDTLEELHIAYTDSIKQEDIKDLKLQRLNVKGNSEIYDLRFMVKSLKALFCDQKSAISQLGIAGLPLTEFDFNRNNKIVDLSAMYTSLEILRCSDTYYDDHNEISELPFERLFSLDSTHINFND